MLIHPQGRGPGPVGHSTVVAQIACGVRIQFLCPGHNAGTRHRSLMPLPSCAGTPAIFGPILPGPRAVGPKLPSPATTGLECQTRTDVHPLSDELSHFSLSPGTDVEIFGHVHLCRTNCLFFSESGTDSEGHLFEMLQMVMSMNSTRRLTGCLIKRKLCAMLRLGILGWG